jgi:hypothetical protein
MSTGRNLDEELEAQLAGMPIPEDDVDLETNSRFNPAQGVVAISEETNPDWWMVGDASERVPAGESSVSRPTSANHGKKYSVCRLVDGTDVCMQVVGDESSFCVSVGCQTNHVGNAPTIKLETSMVVILKTKDRAFADLTLRGSLVPDDVLGRWMGTTRSLKD